jgi:TolA-binding protein
MKLRHFLLTSAIILSPVPTLAQDNSNIEGRVEKLEKEVRAVQRVVFPGGAGKYFEPEITTGSQPKPATEATPTAGLANLNGRIDSLEAQLASLTGQVEQQENRLRTMEARLKALEAGVKEAAATPVAATPPAASTTKPAASAAKPAAKGNSARASAVAAIEKPSTGDAFKDNYEYGYRLWDAKFYPEAQIQLQATVDNYPKHPRASFARNLLGRAWLDDGKPATAAKIFYANYEDIPKGERAPESLYFLGVSLTQMKDTANACKTFNGLETTFPEESAGRLADRLKAARSSAKCK